MNNFEFLRYVNIGQYLPLDSFLHRRDPRARIVAYMVVIIAITFTNHIAGLLIGFVGIFSTLILSRIPLRYAVQSLLPPLPFLLILALLQIFFFGRMAGAEPIFTYGIIKIYAAGLISAGMLMLRFTVLILALGLTSYTLSTSELIHGLESLLSPLAKIRIPTYDLVLIVQVTLRFIPFLAQAAERIAKAQASRGAEWGTGKGGLLARARQIIPLMIPLFLTSLRRAESMALAMDARCYGGIKKRTSLFEMHFSGWDALTLVVALSLATAILFLNLAG